ncbi:probable serine/threonine-protein kinase fhkD [Mytilus californianus]|uniref:probable serine/threonine-protein kinase fhkD n=1 Tax=Mytilus californianus TaxID=6549 RepID=UPI002247440A|nr:probable serine/threonine-protein kinase fhkD [Mytilus californianus]XP_052096161.1 probable serine/threonine-protein kinase fhkD [Mytilus californianus]XP_052096162.1 probable serine/threonine-protein kinase fhkD [Mytilus californianus]
MTTVWPDPPMEVNLNQTAMHSENPLKNVEIKKDGFFQLQSGTDFLLSSNLNVLLNASKLVEIDQFKHGKQDHTLSKRLPPRDHISDSNCQSSDQIVIQNQSVGPQEPVPLKNVGAIPTKFSVNELEPEDKCNQVKPIYTAVPVNNPHVQYVGGLYQLLNECGIEYREETVESQNDVPVREVTTACQQYTQGHIIHGDKNALEMLAKDVISLKIGTHGVITNPKFDFLWNSKCSVKKQKILGRGGNGTVELCNYNDVDFVTKTISRDFRANEVMFTNCLSHEFIVKSHGLIVRNGTPQIIMDYAGDNLLHYGLSKMVDESEIWNITYQILEALNYLHSNQIRHFDVKPENIVLMEDASGNKTLKLADFGGATLFTEEVDCLSWTPAYMAPEMDQFYLNKQFPGQRLITTSCGQITEKCDIYSLALSILFLYVRGHILIKHITKGVQAMVGYEKADTVSMKIVVMNAKNPSLAESLIPQVVGKEMKSLLSGMLKGNVDDRWTAKAAMDQMKELSSASHKSMEPKKIIRRKSKSTENKPKNSQIIRPKVPKLVIVTLDKTGKKVGEYKNTEPFTIPRYTNGNTLETEEHQRPLRDLNIDLQLNVIIEQSNNVKDEKMKQIIDEENRPLLKRLVKRKLKDKVNGEIAFKMTKMREELESSGSSSSGMSINFSGRGHVIMAPTEPEVVPMNEGPGNIPNFDMFLDC